MPVSVRLFSIFLLTLMLATFAHAATPAEIKAVMEPVDAFVKAFNKADKVMPPNVFTADAIVADGFAPYRWIGDDAAAHWYAALMGTTDADHAKFVAEKNVLTLEKPHMVEITGDTAYVVAAGAVAYAEDGKPHRESAQWVLTEKRIGGHWLISSHSWAITARK